MATLRNVAAIGRPQSSSSSSILSPVGLANAFSPARLQLLLLPPPHGNLAAMAMTRKRMGRFQPWQISVGPIPPSPLLSSESELESEKVMKELCAFLEADLPHLFDDQGIDRTCYDDRVEFRDPITKYDTIDGYLFNIQMLRYLFRPAFNLHQVAQTGPNEITTRWTMTMNFSLLPWRPELIFTGTSVMRINPKSQKFCYHADYWDSIKNNEYFSLEGLIDLLKQLQYYKTPDLQTPKYKVLKRAATYEIREYEPFIVAETKGDLFTGSQGFNDVAGYIFGKNARGEKIQMTTPVLTEAFDKSSSDVWIQIVLPLETQLAELPAPLLDKVRLRQVSGGFVAATKFSGKPTEDLVLEKERELRAALVSNGLKAKDGFLVARYNDPGRTWSFVMRNEVLIALEDYTLG